MNEVLLLIGGNLGKRDEVLAQARKLINDRIGDITDTSSVYETAPWGFSSDKPFLNQVVKVKSNHLPHKILQLTHQIEQQLGRKRSSGGYQSRLIDIDILLIDGLEMHDKDLEIPHPRLHKRNFTMVPLAEIAGNWVHPVFNKKLSLMAEECNDTHRVAVYEKQPD